MINIGLEDSNRREVTRALNNLLSDEYLLSTKTEFLRCTRLQERPEVHPSELAMVEDLYDDHEILLRSLRGSLAGNASLRGDIGTTELLTRAMQEHEKMVSMLQSVLRKQDQLKEWLKAQDAIQREIGIEVLDGVLRFQPFLQ